MLINENIMPFILAKETLEEHIDIIILPIIVLLSNTKKTTLSRRVLYSHDQSILILSMLHIIMIITRLTEEIEDFCGAPNFLV